MLQKRLGAGQRSVDDLAGGLAAPTEGSVAPSRSERVANYNELMRITQ